LNRLFNSFLLRNWLSLADGFLSLWKRLGMLKLKPMRELESSTRSLLKHSLNIIMALRGMSFEALCLFKVLATF